MDRGVKVISELINSSNDNIAVVTHGALLTLILKHFNNAIGFGEWESLRNPDIYLLSISENENVEISRMFI